jgi:hypothetical protein
MARVTIRNLAFTTVASDGKPKTAAEVTERILRGGYQPRDTKNPQQLRRSVWVALSRDERVKKVGAGQFAAKNRRNPALAPPLR